jgi:hypothetical protein
LADKKKVVRLADGLAVGDRVKVLERETEDRETVDIVRDTTAGQGQQGHRARKAPQKR